MMAVPGLLFLPFLLSGGIKAAYDIALWVQFRRLRPPEEQQVNRLFSLNGRFSQPMPGDGETISLYDMLPPDQRPPG